MPRTARDWELYSDMPGAERAAGKLSGALRKLIRTATPEDLPLFWNEFSATLNEFGDLGAADTEPRNVALRVLDTVYGPEVVRKTLG
jgi:hypothetical protein